MAKSFVLPIVWISDGRAFLKVDDGWLDVGTEAEVPGPRASGRRRAREEAARGAALAPSAEEADVKSNRTSAVVVHVTPELKAELERLAAEAGLKLSPFCFQKLRDAAKKEAR